MESGIDKTRKLGRVDLQISSLVVNENNPNNMSDREFDLLVDNLGEVGFTDPVLVRPLGDGEYRIVGGHHRVEAARYLGFTEVPCTVIENPDFDDDMEHFQMVRHNTIRGKMDAEKFLALYSKVSGKYADEVLQDMFGFAEEAEFQKLIQQTAKSLPKEMQDKFLDAAAAIKTVDGLAKLLNKMFTMYGDTLPFGYMVFDYGGQQSMWLRVEKKTMSAMGILGTMCIDRKRTVDDVIGKLVQLIAQGDLGELVDRLVEETSEVVLPVNMQVAPTKDNVEMVIDLD